MNSSHSPLMPTRLAALGMALLVSASAVVAQLAGVPVVYDMSWNTVDNGGGPMVGETLGVTVRFYSTIGQPDAHAPGALHAGPYQFAPGFWHDQRLAPVPCLGDVAPPPDGDGFVDVDDLILVILTWGQPNGDGDTNNDGLVDVDDLINVILHWGTCP